MVSMKLPAASTPIEPSPLYYMHLACIQLQEAPCDSIPGLTLQDTGKLPGYGSNVNASNVVYINQVPG